LALAGTMLKVTIPYTFELLHCQLAAVFGHTCSMRFHTPAVLDMFFV
jgi:hypothetical protein